MSCQWLCVFFIVLCFYQYKSPFKIYYQQKNINRNSSEVEFISIVGSSFDSYYLFVHYLFLSWPAVRLCSNSFRLGLYSDWYPSLSLAEEGSADQNLSPTEEISCRAIQVFSQFPSFYLTLLGQARRFLSLEYFLNDQICRLFSWYGQLNWAPSLRF